MRQLLDYTDQSRRVLSASAKHLPRRASDQTRPHSIIANYSSHYADLTVVFARAKMRTEITTCREKKAKGTHFDIFTSLLNTTFK